MNAEPSTEKGENDKPVKVLAFGTVAAGPLTLKQHNHLETYMLAMQAFGDTRNPDEMTEPERKVIFDKINAMKNAVTKADKKNTNGKEKDGEREVLNATLGLASEVLETVDIKKLRSVHTGLKDPSLRKRINARIILDSLKGTPSRTLPKKTSVSSIQKDANFIQLGLDVRILTVEERREVTRLAQKKRTVAKKETPVDQETSASPRLKPTAPAAKLKKAKKKQTATDDGVVTLKPLTISMPSEAYALRRTNTHKSSRRERRAQRMRKFQDAQKRILALREVSLIEHPNTVSISRLCPNPEKKTYVTQELAQQFIKETHPDDPFLRPYRCECGALHIGHSRKGYGGNHRPHVRYPPASVMSV